MVRIALLSVVFALIAQSAAGQAAKQPQFGRAYLSVQEGSVTQHKAVILVYDADALYIWPSLPKGTPDKPLLRFAYNEIASGEYTFGKSPRVAAGLLVTPFFLFSNSKSHWLTIKTANGDYALLRLDKGNYKLVMAELEKQARITVRDIGENK
jgi:hypothetical protein